MSEHRTTDASINIPTYIMPTMQLRFVERGGTDKHPGSYRILQQCWAFSNGKVEWRDVPLESE